MGDLCISALIRGSVKRISHTFRYSSLPVIRRENVAEHSWLVSFYSLMIAKDIQRDTGCSVDYGKLLSRALLHDIDESSSGDVIRVVKYASKDLKEAWDKVAEHLVLKLQEAIRVPIHEEWSTAKADDLEGDVIKVADFASVISYVIEEILTGNKHLEPVLHEVRDYLRELRPNVRPELHPYIDELVKLR